MDQASITQYVLSMFDGVDADTSTGDTFFFYDPARKFPFATIVTRDNDFDNVSKLDRPSVFRLNIGVSKPTYQSLFASVGAADEVYDFTAMDRLMPHPIYGRMYWVCVLNPSAQTFESVRPLLADAYDLSVRNHTKPTPADEP